MIFARFEALKMDKKIFFFHASEIENLTYIDSIDELWGERGERNRRDAMERWERWEWNIDHHGKSLYKFSHSIDWLAFITHDIHRPMSVEFCKRESEMEILSILT